MRPRHYTAENPSRALAAHHLPHGFNEAAALHRGKPGHASTFMGANTSFNEAAALHRGKPMMEIRKYQLLNRASMRPRHYTAENKITFAFRAGLGHKLQ